MVCPRTHNLTSVNRAFAAAWQPRVRPVRSEWVEENVKLPMEFSAQGGYVSFLGREYEREILDAVDDPGLREIVIVAAPQVGKTILERVICVSQGEVDAAPMMFAGPDADYVKEQQQLIYRIADESPALRALVPPLRLRNNRWIDLKQCYIFLAWSGSRQRLSGRSCKIVLCSEVDGWKKSPQLARQRTSAFWRSCFIQEGSPVDESQYLWPAYKRSDQRRYKVPCPHCGHEQELRFFPHREGAYAGKGGIVGLKDDKGEWLSPEEGRRRAYYLGECGCRIESKDKAGMVARGRWVAEGPAGRVRGYQLSKLYAPTCSFADMAEAYLSLRDSEEGRKSFTNDWLGLPFSARGRTPKWEDLGRRLAGAYPRGIVPPWAYFLTGSADVQEDRVYWAVRAWGDRCTSALVDWGELVKTAAGEAEDAEVEFGSDLAQIDAAILDQKWPVAGEGNPVGYGELAVCKLGVDSGHRATEVYAYVRGHPGDRVIAIAGDPKISPGTLYRLQRLEKNVRTGEPYPEGTERYGIDTSAYKTELLDRWSADRRKPGAWWLPSDVLSKGGEYLRQLCNERQERTVVNGRKVVHWVIIDQRVGNHAWDLEVYARAIADMVVGGEWDASKWPWVTVASTRELHAPPREPVPIPPRPRMEGSPYARR